eukprot:CAMPEP_0185256754 /NCGR_PEP_ID=MMETSP1359-20130426/5832_1 /TAXON_ID=552665 /ORGANISM="Bigelowiella longifila, Strain CCMP242" /LENGTH=233 /DNA_ID=CAMNT_0027841483 /DNA_START=14 /DNA_END=712 /DNA_ORIENTATION=-
MFTKLVGFSKNAFYLVGIFFFMMGFLFPAAVTTFIVTSITRPGTRLLLKLNMIGQLLSLSKISTERAKTTISSMLAIIALFIIYPSVPFIMLFASPLIYFIGVFLLTLSVWIGALTFAVFTGGLLGIITFPSAVIFTGIIIPGSIVLFPVGIAILAPACIISWCVLAPVLYIAVLNGRDSPYGKPVYAKLLAFREWMVKKGNEEDSRLSKCLWRLLYDGYNYFLLEKMTAMSW